ASHLWLDMFSAPVWSFFQLTPVPSFKFNLWKYYIPNYGLTSAIKEFKKDMTQLTYKTPDEFHEESTEIFKDVPDGSDPNYMISVLVKELWNNTWHISDRPLGSVLSKISEYTGQDLLTLGDDQFEISEDYAQLLKKYAEEA
ncbi:MAG: hypothetical protein SVK08_11165, partial [Halobacteriota archaeon]|nr:hypothetical protein [Halobacteriota archaeon]